jgi:hypothetical protein
MTPTRPLPTGHVWLDSAAGPVVRPYTLTQGRTRPAAGSFDPAALVVATNSRAGTYTLQLQPEHRSILAFVQQPRSVADLTAHLDLSLGIVRVLLGDLTQHGLIASYVPPTTEHGEHVLDTLVTGLRSL